MPSVLVYQLKTANNNLDTEWVKNIDTSVLHIDFKYVLQHLFVVNPSLQYTGLTQKSTHIAPSTRS